MHVKKDFAKVEFATKAKMIPFFIFTVDFCFTKKKNKKDFFVWKPMQKKKKRTKQKQKRSFHKDLKQKRRKEKLKIN